MPSGGQNSKYTPEREKIILDALRENPSLQAAAKLADVSVDTIYHWEEKHPSFAAALSRARIIGFHGESDLLRTIPDEYHDVNKARLICDNIKWRLSKLVPHIYGDRIDVNVTNTADIAKALETAKARLPLPMRYQSGIEDAQVVDTPQLESKEATEDISPEGDAAPIAPEDLLK